MPAATLSPKERVRPPPGMAFVLLLLAHGLTAGAADTTGEREAYRLGAVRFGQEHELRAQPFSPQEIPGLRLWLRADTGVTRDGQGRVSAWSDPERGVTLRQARPELQPLFYEGAQNGKPALRTTVKTALAAPDLALAGEDATLVVVARVDEHVFSSQFAWYNIHYSPKSFGLGATWGRLHVWEDIGKSRTVPAAKSREVNGRGFLVLQADHAATAGRHAVYENGEMLGTGPRLKESAPATGPVSVGSLAGAIAEVLVFNRVPNELERGALTRYLMNKYGLGGNYVTPLAPLLPFAYYPSSSEIEVAFDRTSPLLREYFGGGERPEVEAKTQPGLEYALFSAPLTDREAAADAGEPEPPKNKAQTRDVAKQLKREAQKVVRSKSVSGGVLEIGDLTPDAQGVLPVVTVAPAETAPVWTRTSPTMPVLAFRGFVDVPTTGTYTFSLRYGTDYGTSRLYVAGKLVVQKGFYGQGFSDLGGAIALKKGRHPLFFVASVPHVLADQPRDMLLWTPPGAWAWTPVPAACFSHAPADTAWTLPAAEAPTLTQDGKWLAPKTADEAPWTPGRELAELKQVEFAVVSLADGAEVKRFALLLDAGGRGQQRFKLPELAEGRYAVDWHVAGRRVRATRTFERRRFAWEKNTLGQEHKVYPPFEEVKVKGHTVSVVDRTYTLNAQGLFDSVVSQGRELLAAPMQLVVESENGERLQWKPAGGGFSRGVTGKVVHPDQAVFECAAQSPDLALQSSVSIEEDGCARINLTLTPDTRHLTPVRRAWLEVPYRDAEVPLMVATTGRNASFGPFCAVPRGKVKWKHQSWSFTWWEPDGPPGDGVFWTANDALLWGDQRSTFQVYVWLGGMERGLCWFASPQPGLVSDGVEPMQELDRQGDRVILRAYFIKQPVTLTAPLRYEFGLQGTPTKPLDPEFRKLDIPGPNGVTCLGGYMCSSKYPDNADFFFLDLITRPAREKRQADAADRQAVKDWFARRVWPDQVNNYEYEIGGAALDSRISRLLNPEVNHISYIEEHATFARQPEWQVFQDEWGTQEFDRFQASAGNRYSGAPSYNDFVVYSCHEYLKRGISLYWDNGGPRRYLTNPYLTGFVGEANAIWRQREYYRRVWKVMNALNQSGTPFRRVFTVGNAQNIVPHVTWFSAMFGSEVTGRRHPGLPSRPNEEALWAFAKGKGLLLPLSRDLVHAGILMRFTGVSNIWGGGMAFMLPTDAESARKDMGMRLVHDLARSVYQPDQMVWSSYPDPRQYGLRMKDYFAWFGYGHDGVAVHNYWADTPFVSVSDPDVAWIALEGKHTDVRVQGSGNEDGKAEPDTRHLTPDLPPGLLLLQSYKLEYPTTVAVGFPNGTAMMDLFTRELFTAGPDGKVRVPLDRDFGVRLLAVGRTRNELPATPGPGDVVLADFELGLPADLDPLYHQPGLACLIVADAGQPGNHILRLKRPLSLSVCSKARDLCDAAISFRFRLPVLPEKTGQAFSYAWKTVKGHPDTTQYDGVVWVHKSATGALTWTLSRPRAVVSNRPQPFTDLETDLTDKPLSAMAVNTEWHTLTIETRGPRHTLRFDGQTVFAGNNQAIEKGGFSLRPGVDPYLEFDDFRIRQLETTPKQETKP